MRMILFPGRRSIRPASSNSTNKTETAAAGNPVSLVSISISIGVASSLSRIFVASSHSTVSVPHGFGTGEGKSAGGSFSGKTCGVSRWFNTSSADSTKGAPVFIRWLTPCALGSRGVDGTAKTSRPYSKALFAVIKEPECNVASMTVSPVHNPEMIRLRLGKFAG